MSRTESHWMPPTNRMGTSSRQVVGAVKGQSGNPLAQNYQDLLIKRLIDLLDQEPDPEQALKSLVSQLAEEEIGPPNLEWDLNPSRQEILEAILRDGQMMQKLQELGVPGPAPAQFPTNDPKAQQMYEEISLEGWLTSLLAHEPNPDR